MDTSLDRLLHFTGEVTGESVKALTGEILGLMRTDREAPITLHIHSRGGSTSAGFAFFDLMNIYKPKLTTVAVGHVGSMALIMFLCGSKRVAGRNTEFYLHDICHSIDKPVVYSLTELQKVLETVQGDQDSYALIIQDRTGGKLSVADAHMLMKANTYISAEEAVGYSLAHEIA